MVILFNQRLEAFCKERKITFVDASKDMIGEEGIVKSDFKRKDPLDVHIDFEAAEQIYKKKIEEEVLFKGQKPHYK